MRNHTESNTVSSQFSEKSDSATEGGGGATAKSIKILHVDDDAGLRELVADQLTQRDDSIVVYNKQTATNGLRLLTEESIDCIISDYDMPGMTGFEFLRAVTELDPTVPFILFTGHGNASIQSAAIEAGATACLEKNGIESYDDLYRRIRQAIT